LPNFQNKILSKAGSVVKLSVVVSVGVTASELLEIYIR